MKELDNAEQIRSSGEFLAQEMQRLTELSELVDGDRLRYERLLDLEEEMDEL